MRKSKQPEIFSLFVLSICYVGITMAQNSPCEDWEPYKDEKCIKIIDETQPYDNAIKTCQKQENSSSLISIRSLEEQEFFSNLLFKTHKVVDAVWIEAKFSSNKFKWADDSDVRFTNWAEGSPSNTTDKACVQMVSEGSSIGKWLDEPCSKKNLVVCQKMQSWSLSRLQKTLLNARKELQDSLEDVRKQLKESQEDRKRLNSSLEDVKKNPVPIGFIYVQLPSQPEPKTLWSMVEWKDVTSEYAGLFFRAEGGGSAAFEQIQNENSPRLTAVTATSHANSNVADFVEDTRIVIAAGETSKKVHSGDHHTWPAMSLSFEVSGGEVRPRNKAMRIWKRTK